MSKHIGHHGDQVENDGGEVLKIIDSEDQALWIRVGPVYHDDKVDHEPGVWIEYQSKHMASPLAGPVLLSLDTLSGINRWAHKRYIGWYKELEKRKRNNAL